MHFFSRHSKQASEPSALPTARHSNPFARRLLVYTEIAAFSLCTFSMQLSPAAQLLAGQQKKQNPVDFQLDGWHVKLTLSFPNAATRYKISTTAYVFMVKDFDEWTDSSLAPKTRIGLLTPPQTATLHVTQLESSKAVYSFDTTFTVKDYSLASKRATIYVEDSAYASQAISAAAMLDEINGHPDIKNKISLYVPSSYGGANSITQWLGFDMPRNIDDDQCAQFLRAINKVSVPTNRFISGAGRVSATHETGHAFSYHGLGHAISDSLNQIFGALYRPLDSAFHKLPDSSRDFEHFVKLASEDPALNLFRESAYGFRGGHPEDGHEELFASCTSALFCYPAEFFMRLEALRKADPKRAKKAKDAAWLVAIAYLPLRPFEPLVYEELGIPEKMMQPPKALR